MWWAVIFLLLIALLLFMFITPIVVELNSETGRCQLQMTGIGRVNLILDESFTLNVQLFFFNFTIHMLPIARVREIQEEKISERKVRKSHFRLKKIISVMKSFQVQQFYLDLDTGNFVLNSWLFPVAQFFDPTHHRVTLNFIGRNECVITLKNNLLRIVRALLS